MALQNLLDDLATDATLQELLAALLAIAQMSDAHRSLAYSKNVLDDSMRVTMQNQILTGLTGFFATYWGNSNISPAYYSTGSPASMDAREQQKELSRQTFQQVRATRWVIT